MIDFAMLNTLDYAVITIIALSTLFALYRGFIGSFLSLMGWVMAIYLAYFCFPYIQPLLEEKFHIKSHLLVLIGGHTVLMITFLVLFGIFNLFATTAVSAMTKGFMDRSLGAAFGIVRGVIIVSFFFLMFAAVMAVFYGSDDNENDDDMMPKMVAGSQSYPFLKFGKQTLAEFIPDTFYNRMEEAYNDLSKKSVDDRFLEMMSKKIDKQLPEDVKDKIDFNNQDDKMYLSQEEVDIKRTKDYLNAYRNLENADGNAAISNGDLARLEKILNEKASTVSRKPAVNYKEERLQ